MIYFNIWGKILALTPIDFEQQNLPNRSYRKKNYFLGDPNFLFPKF